MTQREKNLLTVIRALCSIILEHDARIEENEKKIEELEKITTELQNDLLQM